MSTMMKINAADGFDARLKKLRRAHSHLAHGYEARVRPDGLIIFRPKRRRASLPVRGLALTLAAVIGFKVLVLLQLGDVSYQARVDVLAAGNPAEQASAWIMQTDPLTRTIAAQIAPLV